MQHLVFSGGSSNSWPANIHRAHSGRDDVLMISPLLIVSGWLTDCTVIHFIAVGVPARNGVRVQFALCLSNKVVTVNPAEVNKT